MQIAPEQGVCMEWLARVMGARRAIEVGTFTGYSARGLGPQGWLLCLDVNERWTRIAQTYWRQAGLTDRITLRLGPAATTLATLPPDSELDLGFIDADKENGRLYYEEVLAAKGVERHHPRHPKRPAMGRCTDRLRSTQNALQPFSTMVRQRCLSVGLYRMITIGQQRYRGIDD